MRVVCDLCGASKPVRRFSSPVPYPQAALLPPGVRVGGSMRETPWREEATGLTGQRKRGPSAQGSHPRVGVGSGWCTASVHLPLVRLHLLHQVLGSRLPEFICFSAPGHIPELSGCV